MARRISDELPDEGSDYGPSKEVRELVEHGYRGVSTSKNGDNPNKESTPARPRGFGFERLEDLKGGTVFIPTTEEAPVRTLPQAPKPQVDHRRKRVGDAADKTGVLVRGREYLDPGHRDHATVVSVLTTPSLAVREAQEALRRARFGCRGLRKRSQLRILSLRLAQLERLRREQ